jgi:hypothetical protein
MRAHANYTPIERKLIRRTVDGHDEHLNATRIKQRESGIKLHLNQVSATQRA